MKNTLRAFIAVDITSEIRKELFRLQSELKKSLKGNISWVELKNIHLTLRFLGQINDEQLEEIKKIVEETGKKIKKFNLGLGLIRAFPDVSNPRIVWVGINYGFKQLNEINAELEDKLEIINFTVREKHFHPHFTIARVKSIDGKNILPEITRKIRPKLLTEAVDKLIIFQSELTPQGAKHTELFEAKLST
ncbi:MAG: RNA 2',3'-cyclic phosphodiesterase [Candidatus Omnitrophica bacterium]|nr:RNA 2',3'-cyclic phosphodiesterase [Candidatus Omnitrophota bacterium]